MTTTNQSNIGQTLVAFHIGRGGRFNNAGHKEFICIGKTIIEVGNYYSNDSFFPNEETGMCYDCNGNELIDINAITGIIDWDGNYDTDIVKYLDECDKSELTLLLENSHLLTNEVEEYIIEKLKS